MTTKLPKTIVIVGIPYHIQWVDHSTAVATMTSDVVMDSGNNSVEFEEQVVVNGVISFDDEKILIDRDRPTYSKKATLLHEVLHGCLHQINKDNDEDLVDGLSYILLDVLRRNPDFVAYLMEGVGNG